MSPCFVLDTPLEGWRTSNSGSWQRKYVLLKILYEMQTLDERPERGMAGEAQGTNSFPPSASPVIH